MRFWAAPEDMPENGTTADRRGCPAGSPSWWLYVDETTEATGAKTITAKRTRQQPPQPAVRHTRGAHARTARTRSIRQGNRATSSVLGSRCRGGSPPRCASGGWRSQAGPIPATANGISRRGCRSCGVRPKRSLNLHDASQFEQTVSTCNGRCGGHDACHHAMTVNTPVLHDGHGSVVTTLHN